MEMESLALTASIITGLAALVTILRSEASQRGVKVYTDASYRAEFGGLS